MKRLSKGIKLAILAVLLAGCALAGYLYYVAYAPNSGFEEEARIFFIEEKTDIETWIQQIDPTLIRDENAFLRLAGWKHVNKLLPGRYRFKKGMNNNAMINMLRSGSQAGISIRIDDCQNMFELAGRLGKYLKSDSGALAAVFSDEQICAKYGFNAENIGCMIVPDTYEFLWTNSPDDILSRMEKLRKKYWTDEKLNRAKILGMKPVEVCILASIVKAECSRKDEAPKIAGLYLNRLRIDMPLQADPTALFAKGLRGVSRVYSSMTDFESPYNTYKNKGLPPGPIRFVENNYLDAVLFAETHSYLYMCAQPGGTGYHNFAKSYDQHLEYQRSYTDWLNKKGIH